MAHFRAYPFVRAILGSCLAALALPACSQPAETAQAGAQWQTEWPDTNFSQASVDFSEIKSGGPPRDGIPSIDDPQFAPPGTTYPLALGPEEPVISLEIGGEARGYPLRILTRHEIVNDTIGGRPVAVTYCPLCNSSVAFDRRLNGRTLEFGTTGKLRYSDLVMYDRQTESWWQQFLGEAIVGELTGEQLTILPSRVESLARFRERYPDGHLLLPVFAPASYNNPYVDYDSRERPYPFFDGELPENIEPMARVVAVGNRAWALASLAERGRIEDGDLVLRWTAGQNSALDTRDISQGRDVGNVVVQRRTDAGLADVPYDVTFAFAFHAFHPEAEISTR